MSSRAPVDLRHSLLGGQAFLWREAEEGRFEGVVGGRAWALSQRAAGVFRAEGPSPAEARRYFRIEAADAARRTRLARDPALAPAMAAYPGLRLLRQDPWETTVAFLTSANNHVPRIAKILRALVDRYGEPLQRGTPTGARAFPTAARLARAGEAELRAAGLGYRAPFLRGTARAVARGDVDLAALRGAGADEAREALLALPGVGPKVADCIALFSLDVDDSFPVDRWILRAVAEASGRDLDAREATAWARDRWGGDAGLAQQFLFHALRLREGAPGTRRPASKLLQ